MNIPMNMINLQIQPYVAYVQQWTADMMNNLRYETNFVQAKRIHFWLMTMSDLCYFSFKLINDSEKKSTSKTNLL